MFSDYQRYRFYEILPGLVHLAHLNFGRGLVRRPSALDDLRHFGV